MVKLILPLLILLAGCTPKGYITNDGFVFGTSYHIVYEHTADIHNEVMAKIGEVDWSLSTYKDSSVISRVNKNDDSVVLDAHFLNVFSKSLEVSQRTDSAFDITVAPLVNAWGFGFSKKETITPEKIDSILPFVGIAKVRLVDGKIVKDDPRLKLDASAIAKGYGVDVAANYLESVGIVNYMVEIGGEIRAKGINAKGITWGVGIDKPIDDPAVSDRKLQAVVRLGNHAMATSGNYRNFYVQDGKKYAHTINPKTGYPKQSDILSATVIAPDCMTADAYATAFMVLGLEHSIKIVESDPSLEAYFIYSDDQGNMLEKWTEGFDRLLEKE
jgi:FAD:protein FMN transferase